MRTLRRLTLFVLLFTMLAPAAIRSVDMAHAATASISLSPFYVQAGTNSPVTVNGSGFTPGNQVSVLLDNAIALGNVVPVANGSFALPVTIPSVVSAGQHTVTASDGVVTASQTLYAVSITLSTTNAPPGTPVTISGTGFYSSQPLVIFLGGQAVVSNATTAANGTFSQTFTVPALPAGQQPLVIQNGTSSPIVVTAVFTVGQAALTLTPSTVAAGGSVSVSGAGLPANATLTLKLDATVLTNQLATNGNGAFGPIQLTVPANTSTGTHTVTVSDSSGNVLATATLTVTGGTAALTVSPSTVGAGGTFNLSGAGFAANSVLTIKLDTQALGVAVTDGNGAFGPTAFVVPAGTSNGAHTLTASNAAGNVLASTTLTVTGATATLTVSPSTVGAGGTFNLSGIGFPANTTLTIKLDTTTLTTALTTSNSGTFGPTTFVLPGGIVNGAHTIAASNAAGSVLATTSLTVTGATATLTVSPSTASVGGTFNLSGVGFPANTTLTIKLDSTTLTTALATSSVGTFGPTAFLVPVGTTNGTHTIAASNPSGSVLATTSLTVTGQPATVTVSPNPATVGAQVRITGAGFAPLESVSLSINGGAPFATVSTGSGGDFVLTVSLPTTLSAGTVSLTATGASSHRSATTTLQLTVPSPITAGSTTWYFASGRTDSGFSTEIAILNPNSSTVQGTILLYYGAGQVKPYPFTLGSHARGTFDLGQILGFGTRVAAQVQASLPVAVASTTHRGVEDLMSTTGVPAPSRTWYMAEGYTGLTFQEDLDLLNPGSQDAHVQISWPLFNGRPPVQYAVTLPAHSRQTIAVNTYVDRASHATVVHSDQPVVAGRTLLFGTRHQGATSKAGATGGNTLLYFAEGSTNNGFEEYLTILNPDLTRQAQVTASFYDRQGQLLGIRTIVVDPLHRGNIKVNDVTQNTAISTILRSTVPIIAERAMYFGAPNGGSADGTAVFGVPRLADGWAFATGDTRPGRSEFELLFNPNRTASTIEATYYLDNGQVVQRTFSLPGNTRLNVDVTLTIPELPRGYHGVILRSLNGVPFVAEQALYDNNMANGSATVGTPLQ